MALMAVSGPMQYRLNLPLSGASTSSFTPGGIYRSRGSEGLTILYDDPMKVKSVTIQQFAADNKTVLASATISQLEQNIGVNDIFSMTKINNTGLIPQLLRGNDTIYGSGNLLGGDGNDYFLISNSGHVDGGSGINTLSLPIGTQDTTQIVQTGAASFSIQTWTAFQSTTVVGPLVTASDIQRIRINDNVTAYDISGNAGQAYRLYQAAFDRTPDKAGLSSQVNALDHGTILKDIANNFVNSGEFILRYGSSPSNTEFVTALYKNTLHRSPDIGGLSNWVNALNSGSIDRASALISFSDSAENHINTDPILVTGIQLDANYLQFV